MATLNREKQFFTLFPGAPAFRWRQVEGALFQSAHHDFLAVSPLPEEMRKKLAANMSWLAVSEVRVLESAEKDTFKSVVALSDKKRIETVLMKNARGQWTVCVSAQVGCAMACSFCATGQMGFLRNLTSDEIIDQYRFWKIFLDQRPFLQSRISNIVFMGMGEPLANYDAVKGAISTLLRHTDLGPTHITVSTVGLLPMLRALLSDQTWPPVRLAVSLHSADRETRESIMPTSFAAFLDELAAWTEEYFKAFESRRRHLTFEYVMLSKVNDTESHAQALIRFARKVGKVRINLIPYNATGSLYQSSLPGDFERFQAALEEAGVTVTRRRTMGDDISAACGQLITEKQKA